MSRTAARETAARLIYQWELGGGTWREAFDYALDEPKPHLTDADMRYIDAVMEGLPPKLEEIDGTISRISQRWRLERMGKMDLAILRLAIYEMIWRDDIPESVSINEAVELAKKYGSDETPVFINGMLSTLSKRMKGQAPEEPPDETEAPEALRAAEAEHA